MGIETNLLQVLHKERITTSSPTPQHLTTFNISIFDQFSPPIHYPLLLFYPNNINPDEARNIIDPQCLVVQRTKLLKRSLSEALTRFYPFAGRIHDHASVSCNDRGALFLQAKVNCHMSKALEKPDLGFVRKLIPSLESTDDPLLVQANFFECGGIAIGFNVSHKLIDAYTLCTFLNSWSAISRGVQLPPHQYVGAASRFPPLELFKPTPSFVKISKERCTTRRFLFESSKIDSLKSEAASAAVKNPTRVEVVSSLIWKCAMEAAKSDSARQPSSSAWLQTVNMRKILSPSAENLMGNLLGFFPAISTKGDSEKDLQGLVAAMRKGLEELKVKYGVDGVGVEDVSKHLKGYGEMLPKDDIECYCCTSWCRMPFSETDFGWGKPTLISIPAIEDSKNWALLKDTSDGRGIEVRLTLKEEDMAIVEKNEELLAYASLNPAVI